MILRGKVKEILLDILNLGKIQIAPRKFWITQAVINQMEERRKAKISKVKEY
jgi:hypothetical protein